MENCTYEDLDLSIDDFEFLNEIDLDFLNEKIPESPPISVPFEEIEKFLLGDVEDAALDSGDSDALVEEFVEGVFAPGSESDTGNCSVATPDSTPESGVAEENREGKDADADDEISRKKRRQMKNRESAMNSRERKKMYVKELEMKSKYLESECKRLDYALRCCVAENHALHQLLQMGRPLGVSVAKQESAVLFVESLLLGSLFWLLIAVCLSHVTSLSTPNPKEGSRLESGLALESRNLAKSKIFEHESGYVSVTMRRRCRGMRGRIKLLKFPSVLCS